MRTALIHDTLDAYLRPQHPRLGDVIREVLAIEPRTVLAFSTTSKIGSGKAPGGSPTSDILPRLCSMRSAPEARACA